MPKPCNSQEACGVGNSVTDGSRTRKARGPSRVRRFYFAEVGNITTLVAVLKKKECILEKRRGAEEDGMLEEKPYKCDTCYQ